MLEFRPKLSDALRGYDRATFLSDLAAGVTIGVVALPLAIGFAIASGVEPSRGLWTAIIAGFVDKVGLDNVCTNIDAALSRARQLVENAGTKTNHGG